MRYTLTEKAISWNGEYAVQNEAKETVYKIIGSNLGNRMSFQTPDGEEIASIVNKSGLFKSRFQIYRGDTCWAQMSEEPSLFKARFVLDVPGPRDIVATGDFLAQEYTFTRDGESIATVSRKFSWGGDTFAVETQEGAGDILILLAAVVIDLCRSDPPSP